MLPNYAKHFASWVLSRTCICCGLQSSDSHVDLCVSCKTNLPWLQNSCYQCGLPLELKIDVILCEHCRNHAQPFNRLCALFSYEPPITTFINQLKFSKKLYPGLLFAHLLAQAILYRWYVAQSLPDVIIPVPLHQKRHRRRGYNQALEISIPLSKKLHIPIAQHACRRVKETLQQSRLSKIQRADNVDKAFIVDYAFRYKNVVIVDDVVTTGSTIRAMCMALQAVGVTNIDIWCICRA